MIVDPVIRRGFSVGELGSLRFRDDDSSAVNEALDGRGSRVLRGVERVECAIAATSTKTFHVEDILHGDARTSEGLFGARSEVETGGHGDANSRCTVDMGRKLRETALSIGYGSVQERLVLVAVQAPD